MVYQIVESISKVEGITVFQAMENLTKSANYVDGTLVELALQMMYNQDREDRGMDPMEGTSSKSMVLEEITDYISMD